MLGFQRVELVYINIGFLKSVAGYGVFNPEHIICIQWVKLSCETQTNVFQVRMNIKLVDSVGWEACILWKFTFSA